MFYVIAQMLLLLLIVWPLASFKLSPFGLVLIVLSMILALLSLLTNRPGNFNVRPDPKLSGALIVHGPYKYIRHPMYSALFVGCAGILLCQFNGYKLIAWLLLIVVLAFKARYEEKALTDHHLEYQAYQKKTHAFIPWIW